MSPHSPSDSPAITYNLQVQGLRSLSSQPVLACHLQVCTSCARAAIPAPPPETTGGEGRSPSSQLPEWMLAASGPVPPHQILSALVNFHLSPPLPKPSVYAPPVMCPITPTSPSDTSGMSSTDFGFCRFVSHARLFQQPICDNMLINSSVGNMNQHMSLLPQCLGAELSDSCWTLAPGVCLYCTPSCPASD